MTVLARGLMRLLPAVILAVLLLVCAAEFLFDPGAELRRNEAAELDRQKAEDERRSFAERPLVVGSDLAVPPHAPDEHPVVVGSDLAVPPHAPDEHPVVVGEASVIPQSPDERAHVVGETLVAARASGEHAHVVGEAPPRDVTWGDVPLQAALVQTNGSSPSAAAAQTAGPAGEPPAGRPSPTVFRLPEAREESGAYRRVATVETTSGEDAFALAAAGNGGPGIYSIPKTLAQDRQVWAGELATLGVTGWTYSAFRIGPTSYKVTAFFAFDDGRTLVHSAVHQQHYPSAVALVREWLAQNPRAERRNARRDNDAD